MKSQADRVLRVLKSRPGVWFSIAEIHERAGTMRLNSRISDLRAKGYEIECRPNGAKTKYRLVSEREEAQCDRAGHGSDALSGDGVPLRDRPGASSPLSASAAAWPHDTDALDSIPGQLTLEAA